MYGRKDRSSLRVIPATGGVGFGRFLGWLGGTSFLPPAWSRDSRRIAVVNGNGRLLIVNPSAGRVTASTGSTVGVVGGFTWSRDSSRLLVAARPPVLHACASLWLVNARTAAARPLRRCR
jgi:Tol biopolymer transport system component